MFLHTYVQVLCLLKHSESLGLNILLHPTPPLETAPMDLQTVGICSRQLENGTLLHCTQRVGSFLTVALCRESSYFLDY